MFEALLEAGRDRGITIKIAQNTPSQLSPNVDTEYLTKKAHAEVNCLFTVKTFYVSQFLYAYIII